MLVPLEMLYWYCWPALSNCWAKASRQDFQFFFQDQGGPLVHGFVQLVPLYPLQEITTFYLESNKYDDKETIYFTHLLVFIARF